MPTRSLQLQIRVTPRQKAELRRRARAAGIGMSEYVLARALPEARDRFAALMQELGAADEPRLVLAELNDLLASLTPTAFTEAVAAAAADSLTPNLANYVAAMVEHAAHLKQVPPPEWTSGVAPLAAPHFATNLRSLRAHLLRSAPVPYRRRNIFVDTGVGGRV